MMEETNAIPIAIWRSDKASIDENMICENMTSPPRPFPNPADGLLLGGIFTGIGGWEIAAGKDWTHTFTAEMDKHART